MPPLNLTSVASETVHLCSDQGSGAEASAPLIPGDVERASGGLCSQVQKAVHAAVLGFVSRRITGVLPSVSNTDSLSEWKMKTLKSYPESPAAVSPL